MPDAELATVQRLHAVLKLAHSRNATAPINGPDEYGAFASSSLAGGMLGRGVPPIVADANRLRDDILYSCRNGRRTVLVTAANSGAIRIFCASHVLEEVIEHAREWAMESRDVSHAQFLKRWSTEYLPLIREVRDGDIPFGLLSPTEIHRIRELYSKDRDDVPSATLALALGAFFLSEDTAALRAVYGPDFDMEGHRAWLDLLKAGGDASELGTMMFSVMMIPTAAGAGIFHLGRWLSRTCSPWVLLPIGLGFALLGAQVSPEARANLRSGLSDAGMAFGYMYAQYEAAFERFRQAAPPVPGWTALADTTDRRMVLARAALHEFARAPSTPMSARTLSNALPSLGVGQSEQLVRQTMRANACFDMPYDGQWQVGHPPRGLMVDSAARRTIGNDRALISPFSRPLPR
jgi:hypothetical protein